MSSTRNKRPWSLPLLLLPLMLAACATASPPPPVPVVSPQVQLDPLPASVTKIDLNSSASWRAKVSNWLSRVEAFLTVENSN